MYVENVELFLSQKSQFDLVEQKNKNRTRASLSQSSEDGKQEILFMWPNAVSVSFKDAHCVFDFLLIYIIKCSMQSRTLGTRILFG